MQMKAKQSTSRKLAITGCLTAMAALSTPSAIAQGQGQGPVDPPIVRMPAWYDGMEVTQIRQRQNPETGDTVVALKDELQPDKANPFYVFVGGGSPQQAPVIGAIPGDPDYTGWWQVRIILNYSGRDLLFDPFTSTGEVEPLLCDINVDTFPANIGECIANGKPLVEATPASAGFPFIKIPIVNAVPPGCDR